MGAITALVQSQQAKIDQSTGELGYRYSEPILRQGLRSEDGRVTRKSVAAGGTTFRLGQSMFALVPDDVWVTANFKEDQIGLMRPGQPVEIDVDALPGGKFEGRVDSIQAGSGAAFSLLPPENATGNYVKVVQRVPVKIVFNQQPAAGLPLGPGESGCAHRESSRLSLFTAGTCGGARPSLQASLCSFCSPQLANSRKAS